MLVFKLSVSYDSQGGAGTTAAGLRYGLPTLVCPFFGDQFMVRFICDLDSDS